MDFEPNYGSSEYSPKAEELFAGFLLEVERAQLDPASGPAPDFEQFCAEHDGYADELYGLHADWDNVRGLVAQMNGLRTPPPPPAPPEPAPLSPTAAEIAEREAKIEPFSVDDVPDPKEEVHVSSLQRWKNLATAMVTLAILASLWAANQFRSSQVLAQEKDELISEQEAAREELMLAQTTREALAQEGKQLADKLKDAERAQGELQDNQLVLSRNLDEARAGQEKLQVTAQELEASLRAERERSEAAAAQAREAQERAALLALGVEATELLEQEATLWPTASIDVLTLEAWLGRAEALRTAWSARAHSTLEVPESISRLLAQPGPIPHTQGRLALMKAWEEASGAAGPWTTALAQINNLDHSPELAGLDLSPQFGLVPLGRSSKDGLWRFADEQTGGVPELDEEGEVQAGPGSALVFVLIPGVELEGKAIAPFLVSETPWTAQHHLRAFGTPEPPADSELEGRIAYEKALVRMGYEPLSRMQAMLARPFGLSVASWERFPVRAIR